MPLDTTQIVVEPVAPPATAEAASSAAASAPPPNSTTQPAGAGGEFEMFSTRRPRNLVAGVASGGKSLLKGFFGGAVGLVAAPIVGAKDNGLQGFVAGLGTGLVGAIALPVTGAAIASFQVVRGVINTGEAIVEGAAGKDWDEEKREWYAYDLSKDADRIRALDEFGGPNAGENEGGETSRSSAGGGTNRGSGLGRSGRPPKDSEYYELLGVAADAPTDVIKKAYYKRALKLHPDKNPGDAEAAGQFQKISEAYQVLADDNMRARYDANGKSATDGSQFMDAGVFFTMLFGSERFETYIGTLALASAASMDGTLSMHRMGVRQQKREVDLALKLVEMTRRFVDGDVEGFEGHMRSEAKELAAVSFGDCLLYATAELYGCRAAEFLGYSKFLAMEGHLAALRTKKVSIQNHTAAAGAGIRAAGAAIRTFKAVKEIADKAEEGKEGGSSSSDPMGGLSAHQLKATQDNLPIFLEAMWHVSVVDIERTLTAVTHKVCKDHSVDEATRAKRAEAIALMAKVFMEEAVAKGGSKDPKAKVTEMIKQIAPQMGKPEADASTAAPAAAPAAPAEAPPAAQVHSLEELRAMPVKQLKALLRTHGVSQVDAVEKEDLVQVIHGLQDSALGDLPADFGGGRGVAEAAEARLAEDEAAKAAADTGGTGGSA